MSGVLTPAGSRLFRIRKTCLKMLRKRKYIVDEEQLDMTAETFRERFGENPTRESMTILAEHEDDDTDQIFVFFPEDEKVGVKPVKTYCDRMKEEGVTKAIIVVKQGITVRTPIFPPPRPCDSRTAP
jgi:DNA-directed RNA polymerase I, II, and III subunit RPABC1